MEPKHAGTYLARLGDAGKLTKGKRGEYHYPNRVESVETVESGSLDTTHATVSTRFDTAGVA
jgi:hypothetical protein